MKPILKAAAAVLFLFSVSFQGAQAASDEASLHNVVRNALSFGQTMRNLGHRLDQCYEFSRQNRPASPLSSVSNNSSLRNSAKDWAEGCNFQHSGLGGVGENLFVGTTNSTSWTLENAINDWAFEARFVSYPNGASAVGCNDGSSGSSCRSKIGHYTQMVWNTTTQVGCHIQSCPSGVANFSSSPSQLIVCHYSPQGNFFNGTDYLAPYVGQGVISPRQDCSADPSDPPASSGTVIAPIMLLLND